MGTLYVVATPIGNLEDITLRGLRVLREVQLIAAEDTRRTSRLLQHYSITTPTTSLHEHNEARKSEWLLRRLVAGDDLALVSDAGTPLVSDPGRELVRSARKAGHPVVAVPGPSAVLTILAAAGVDADSFTFLGFPPRKANALHKWIETEFVSARPVVFFEAPHRIRTTLLAMRNILGDRPILIGRELTKLHEDLVESLISTHLERLEAPRGEITVLVPPSESPQDRRRPYPGDDVVAREIGHMANSAGIAPRAAARRVAAKYGVPVNTAYRLWTVLKP